MTFAEKLQTLRKERNLSQEQLAAALEVSRQSVSKWELGDDMPKVDKILLLSDFFEVSTDYLLRDDWEEPTRRGHFHQQMSEDEDSSRTDARHTDADRADADRVDADRVDADYVDTTTIDPCAAPKKELGIICFFSVCLLFAAIILCFITKGGSLAEFAILITLFVRIALQIAIPIGVICFIVSWIKRR